MIKRDIAEIDALLKSLWERNLPIVHERLNLLDRIAAEAASGQLTQASRQECLNVAHKLAGSLGMFGYQQGTEIARQIENVLSSPTPTALDCLTTLAADLRQTLIDK